MTLIKLTAILLPLNIILATGCGVGPSKMGSKKIVPRPYMEQDLIGKKEDPLSPQNPHTNPSGPLTLEEIRSTPIAFGIRTYDQIYETMSVLTTVSPATRLNDGQLISQKYQDLTSQMPESNDAKAFLASHQVAISKMAVEYCDALMNDATKRGLLFPSINFSQGPSASLSGGIRNAFAMELIDQFWGRGLNNRPNDGVLQDEIDSLIQDLSVNENANAPTSTLNITKGTCAAVLASAPAMFL